MENNNDVIIKLPPFTVENVVATLSQVTGWGIKQLNVPQTWTVTQGEGITVMIIDTGFSDHSDLAGATIKELSKSFLIIEPDINDKNGHGCVSPDTYVHTNFCGIEKIETLYNRINVPEVYNDTFKGMVKDVSHLGLKTYSLNSKTGESEINKIMLLHRTPVDENIVKFNLDGGTEYKLTPWHPVYVYTGKVHQKFDISRKRADELKVADRMIFGKGENAGQLVKEYFRVNGCKYKVCSHCGKKHPIRTLERKSRWQCKSCNKSKYHEEYSTFMVTEDMAYLCGLILTDGHIYDPDKKQYRIEISSITKELLDGAKEKMDSLGFMGASIRSEENRLLLDSKEFHTVLLNLGMLYHRKTYDQGLPEFVGKSPYSVICAFIAGVIDGDGCINKDGVGHNRITSVSKKFVDQMCCLLNSIDISAGFTKTTKANTKGFQRKDGKAVPIYNCRFANLNDTIVSFLVHPLKIAKAIKQISTSTYRREARRIKTIEMVPYKGDMYDFTVENNHTYLANGHFVSNTHCQGIIGARNNEQGMVGVAPMCKIIACKVLGEDGSGSMDSIVEALKYAKEIKPDVISMSLGCPQDILNVHRLIYDLKQMNIPCVVAAGNDGGRNSVNYPGKYPEVICVGAYDKNGKIANFSSNGPEVGFAAPGVDIYSTYLNNAYANLSGTSMATPFMTGLVALLIAKHRKQEKETGQNDCKTVDQIKAHLIKYADDKGVVGKDDNWGYGVVDPVKLINELNATPPIVKPPDSTLKKTWRQRFMDWWDRVF